MADNDDTKARSQYSDHISVVIDGPTTYLSSTELSPARIIRPEMCIQSITTSSSDIRISRASRSSLSIASSSSAIRF